MQVRRPPARLAATQRAEPRGKQLRVGERAHRDEDHVEHALAPPAARRGRRRLGFGLGLVIGLGLGLGLGLRSAPSLHRREAVRA